MAILKFKNSNNEWESVETAGAVKYTEQTLTDEQKAQVKENIGVTDIAVDSVLSSTSTNPIQNKAVNEAINNLNTLVGDTAVSEQISSAVANKADVENGLYTVTTSGNGSIYTATVPGITSLTNGVGFIMIPHTSSSVSSCMLNVNGLGDKRLYRRLSTGSIIDGASNNWLAINCPYKVVYYNNGWVVEGLTKASALDIQGSVPIASGGTGAETAADALVNLGAAPSAAGQYTVAGVGADEDGLLIFDVTLPEITKEVGTSFIMIPDTSFSSSYVGVCIRLNGESGYGITGTYAYGDEHNVGAFYPVAGKPYRMMYDGSVWVAMDYTTPAKFSKAVTTSGSGTAYTATVPGITSLTSGISFTIIPHTTSSVLTPTLNVNGLGAKYVYRRVSTGGNTNGASSSWLTSGTPYRVFYNGSAWIVEGQTRPVASDMSGTLQIANGGTGAVTAAAARSALGITYANLGTAPITSGGTGATDAISARENLGIYSCTQYYTLSSTVALHGEVSTGDLNVATLFGMSSVPSNFEIVGATARTTLYTCAVVHSKGASTCTVYFRNISGSERSSGNIYYNLIGMCT